MIFKEFIEIKENDPSIFSERAVLLENFKGLGPPDTCVLVKETESKSLRMFTKKSVSYYHHIRYGVRTFSLSSIAAYFGYYLNSHSNLASKTILKKGYFCVFDAFSRSDVRVKIGSNGNPRAYLFNFGEKVNDVQELHWKGAYLSSVLRAIYPVKAEAIACMDFFESIQEIEQFIEISRNFWHRQGYVLDDMDNTEKYGINLIIPAVSSYLIKLKRYKVHQTIFENFVEYDPLFLTYLGTSCIKLKRFEKIIKIIKKQLKITPHTFPLYYILAKAYYKQGNIEKSLKVCKYLVELNLGVYDYWYLLVLCYIKLRHFSSALLCLNVIPEFGGKPENEFPEKQFTIPEMISVMGVGSLWNTPHELDFRPFNNQPLFKTSKEKRMIKELKSLNGSNLKGSSIRTYRLYVKIEKELEWKKLIDTKNHLLENNRPSYEEEKINTQSLRFNNTQSGREKTELLQSLNTFYQENFQNTDNYTQR